MKDHQKEFLGQYGSADHVMEILKEPGYIFDGKSASVHNPVVDDAFIDRAIKEGDDEVRASVINQYKLKPHHMKALIDHPDASNRELGELFYHTNFTKENAHALLNHKNENVRREARAFADKFTTSSLAQASREV